MIRRDQISSVDFYGSYQVGVEILSVCLNQFDFSVDMTPEMDQYLFEIINSFCVLNEMQLTGAVQGEYLRDTSKISAMKVDEAVN
jgi:hypothetical protein